MIEDLLVKLAVGCGIYQATIGFLTGITSMLIAAVLGYLHKQVLPAERWVRFLAWAYGLFALQYFIPAAAKLSTRWNLVAGLDEPAQAVAQAVFSPANSLCFLAAALALLSWGGAWQNQLGPQNPRWSLAGLPVPWPVAALAGSAALLEVGRPDDFWFRLPDALLSASCLGLLGIGLYQNSAPRRHRILAAVNLVGAGLYGTVNVLYAFNPLLLHRNIWPDLENKLQAVMKNFQEARQVDLVSGLDTLKCLDSTVFAVAYLFKISLFFGVLLLIIRRLLILAPDSWRGLLFSITSRRGRYISTRGVLRAIGESVEADFVALCIRLAETKPDNLAWWRWLREPHADKRELATGQLPAADESVVAWIMRDGPGEVLCADLAKDVAMRRRYYEFVPGMRSFVAVPIRHHGAVIACLNVEWKYQRGYSATTVQRIHQLAELLSPTVSFRRQLIALDTLARKFHTARNGASTEGIGQGIRSLIEAVHDALSPLATGFRLRLGFQRIWVGANDQGSKIQRFEQDEATGHKEDSLALAMVRRDERVQIKRERLTLPGSNGRPATEIGTLRFAILPGCDPVTRPSLTDDYLHRRTVASLLTDAVLDCIHEDLTAILSQLQVELNREASSDLEPWFRSIEKAAKQAGLLWAVARVTVQRVERVLGGEAEKELVAEFSKNAEVAACSTPIVAIRHLSSPGCEVRTVLALALGNGAQLYLGLARATFGRELEFASPWRVFLEGLGQAAGSALARIEHQALEAQARRMEFASTKAETSGLVLHTLRNDATALLHGTERLSEMLDRDGAAVTAAVRERVAGLSRTAENLRHLTRVFQQDVPHDDRLSVELMEAVKLIRALYDHLLETKAIGLFVDVDDSLCVGVPIEVAYVSLVTLFVNAVEAIRADGRIEIRAKVVGGEVQCSVTDTGPGINADLVPRLFEPGFSTKSDGNGLGLALARNALRRCGGDLVLSSAVAGQTTFTITFPR